MKWMTPELVNYFQTDEPDHDQEDKWDASCHQYELRLATIRHKLPLPVQRFLDSCCLHDADYDPWSLEGVTLPPRKLQLIFRQQNFGEQKYLAILRYTMPLPGHIKYEEPLQVAQYEGPAFNPEQPCLLYDEFDVENKEGYHAEVFTHEILMSSGYHLHIKFTEFHFILVPLGEGVIEF